MKMRRDINQLKSKDLVNIIKLMISLTALFLSPICYGYVGGMYSPKASTSVVGIIAPDDRCSATKVDSRTLITAAHCAVDWKRGQVLELTTVSGITPGSTTLERKIQNIEIHPSRDMAIVEFDSDLTLWSASKISRAGVELGETVMVGGFGRQQPGDELTGLINPDTIFTYSYKMVLNGAEDRPDTFRLHIENVKDIQQPEYSTGAYGDSGAGVFKIVHGEKILVGVFIQTTAQLMDEFKLDRDGQITNMTRLGRGIHSVIQKIMYDDVDLAWLKKHLPSSAFTNN